MEGFGTDAVIWLKVEKFDSIYGFVVYTVESQFLKFTSFWTSYYSTYCFLLFWQTRQIYSHYLDV